MITPNSDGALLELRDGETAATTTATRSEWTQRKTEEEAVKESLNADARNFCSLIAWIRLHHTACHQRRGRRASRNG